MTVYAAAFQKLAEIILINKYFYPTHENLRSLIVTAFVYERRRTEF